MKQSWEIKKLSEIGKIFNGNSINEKVKKDKYTNLDDGLPFIATKDVGFDSQINYQNGVSIPFNEIKQYKIAPSNTTLICAEGGSAGRKIGFTNQDVCFGNKLFALVPNNNVASKYVFYYYFTSSFQKYFSTEMAGIIGGVSMNKFKDIEIPLPPLPEQQRIVSILDDAFETIAKAKANAEQNLKNAKELFESYLQGVFDNGNWKVDKLGNLLIIERGGSPRPISKYITNSSDGINWIKIADATSSDKYIYETKQKITRDGLHKTRVVNEDDFILSNSMSFGRPYIMKITGCIHDGWLVLKQKDERVFETEFLYYLLSSPYVFKQFNSLAAGSTVRNLNISLVSSVKVPIPSILEQNTITEKLDAISTETKKLVAVYQKKIDDLEELKKSVLQKAFAGELKTSDAEVEV